jgi:3-oxoacyl-[acyl-carrier protein] reductase
VRKIVNVSSTSGTNGNAGQVNYSSGKAGIMGMTRTLAKEWGRYDVTVNAVAFGYIQTRLTKPLNEGDGGTIDVLGRTVKIGVQAGRLAAMNQMIPLGRGACRRLPVRSTCSAARQRHVSGQTLVVNGDFDLSQQHPFDRAIDHGGRTAALAAPGAVPITGGLSPDY